MVRNPEQAGERAVEVNQGGWWEKSGGRLERLRELRRAAEGDAETKSTQQYVGSRVYFYIEHL